MSTVIVRPARPEDDARIGALLVETFVATYAKKMPEVVVSERRKADLRDVSRQRSVASVIVAETGEAVVGTNTAELRRMAVNPAHQGRGIASALIDECTRLAAEWGASTISLHVRRGALGIARMYEAKGFRRAPEGDCDWLPEIYLEAYARPVG
jgi:ribosomal protein S18 acetylase RimI-like enzyme